MVSSSIFLLIFSDYFPYQKTPFPIFHIRRENIFSCIYPDIPLSASAYPIFFRREKLCTDYIFPPYALWYIQPNYMYRPYGRNSLCISFPRRKPPCPASRSCAKAQRRLLILPRCERCILDIRRSCRRKALSFLSHLFLSNFLKLYNTALLLSICTFCPKFSTKNNNFFRSLQI